MSKYENCTHAVCAYDLSARPITTSYTLTGDLPRELNPNVKHVSREVKFFLFKHFFILIINLLL